MHLQCDGGLSMNYGRSCVRIVCTWSVDERCYGVFVVHVSTGLAKAVDSTRRWQHQVWMDVALSRQCVRVNHV